ncbi:hypothetical protein ABI060_14540, partial [Enterococcus faecium]
MRRSWRALALALPLAGCAVGPNFHRPAPPQVSSYTPDPLPAQIASAAGSQSLEQGAPVSARWWTVFGS